MGPWKVVEGRVCTQGGVVPQIPEEILLELRPPKGKRRGMVFQADGTACAKAP